MTSEQTQLEEFFETRFEQIFSSGAPKQITQASFFDGVVFWEIYFTPEDRQLYFRCNTEKLMGAFPIVEAGVFYSQFRVDELFGIGEVLTLTVKEDLPQDSHFVVTKTREKRFSLGTTTGLQPKY